MLTVTDSTFTGYDTADATTTDAVTVAVGDTVLVFSVWQDNATPPTMEDSQTGSFTHSDVVQAGAVISGGSWTRCSRRTITEASAAYSVTAEKVNGYTTVFVVVINGDVESVEFDLLYDTSAPWSLANTTTGAALIVGFISPEGQANLSSIDATPTDFTEIDEILSFDFWQGATAYRHVSSADTYTWTPAVVPSSGVVASAGLILVTLYEPPAGEWTPFTCKRESSGMQPFTTKVRVGGAWVPFLPKQK